AGAMRAIALGVRARTIAEIRDREHDGLANEVLLYRAAAAVARIRRISERSLRIVRAEQITPGRRLAQRPEAPRLFLVGEPRIAFRERDRFAEQELAAAPVEREPLAYRGTVIPTGLDFQAGDDAPPVHGAI